MLTSNCPSCRQTISFTEAPEIGQLLTCHSCQTLVEIVWLFPLEVELFKEKIIQKNILSPTDDDHQGVVTDL